MPKPEQFSDPELAAALERDIEAEQELQASVPHERIKHRLEENAEVAELQLLERAFKLRDEEAKAEARAHLAKAAEKGVHTRWWERRAVEREAVQHAQQEFLDPNFLKKAYTERQADREQPKPSLRAQFSERNRGAGARIKRWKTPLGKFGQVLREAAETVSFLGKAAGAGVRKGIDGTKRFVLRSRVRDVNRMAK